ncbi:transmembrane protein 245 [Microplitis demolitor]|uniref:transmembrane protein 245 n=1 Tax=Microplitis demolitor TaxID=69319 RepID=UPI0004CC9A0F|nr:transmembrane protein 245 [Microplitis demolitor]
MEPPRAPIDNLLNVLSGFSIGHEKALKQSIYNTVALFLLCLVCTASYGLYIILQPFVKPLIWALLCGSVLFPFKLYITNAVKSWFAEADHFYEPLLVNLAMIPIRLMDKISECVGSFLCSRIKYVKIIIIASSLLVTIYWYTPNILTCLTWRLIQFTNSFLFLSVTNCNIYMVSTVMIGYILILCFFWTKENATLFNYASFVIWLSFSLYISNILGVYQNIIFFILQILFIVGFIYEIVLILDSKEIQGTPLTFTEAVQLALTGNKVSSPAVKVDENVEQDEQISFIEGTSTPLTADQKQDSVVNSKKPSLKFIKRAMSLDTDARQDTLSKLRSDADKSASYPSFQTSFHERYFLRKFRNESKIEDEKNKTDTDKYMYGALYSCIGMLMWKHKWILTILTVPIAWYFTKQIGKYFGVWDIIQRRINKFVQFFKTWYYERRHALIPAHVKGLYKICTIIDKEIREILKRSVDAVATTAVIFFLLVFSFCASLFIVIQIYAEGMHLIQITGEIINTTLVHNPDIDWVPEQWENSVNSVLDNAYTYGRSVIADGVKNLAKELEPSKAEILEKKVLELWDRLYQAWMMSNESSESIGPTVDIDAAYSVWESLKESFGKIPTQIFNMSSIQNFGKDNVGILMSVLDSVWSIVKGNLSIVLSVLTELLYVVLISGSAVLSFTLSTVVFFTTLFYLLSSSGYTYKPIELIAVFSPISFYRFAVAVQEAVMEVFAATFKLASFFGMWTWLIHNLFYVKIIYLPSAFAAILAAVPFLDAYFACIPAAIELWFTRGPMIAILFFLFHFLPYNIVMTDFYKEIKGAGHPYLTGLSIAGGIFCLGVEGAIFGPLLLCCIMVAINLSRRYVHSLSEETLDSLKKQMSQTNEQCSP